jgi:hypothetical protein
MKWTFDHSASPVYVRVTVEGEATVDEGTKVFDELLSSKLWHPGLSILIDLTSATPPSAEGVRLVQSLVRYFIDHRNDLGECCIATVRSTADTYNYIRQFEYGIRLRGSRIVVRNFMNLERAVDWLASQAGKCGAEA